MESGRDDLQPCYTNESMTKRVRSGSSLLRGIKSHEEKERRVCLFRCLTNHPARDDALELIA